MQRSLSLFAWLTAGVMFLVVLMGAWVTNTGSGDGCGPHWPLCHGTFMPEWDYEAIVEFSHRGVAGLAGLMTVALLAWVWRALPARKDLHLLAGLGVGFVVLQGGLGALAVLWPQPKLVLALHFGISLLCFSWLLLVAVLLRQPSERPRLAAPPPHLVRWIWVVAAYTYVVIYLGAYVRHVHAAMACTGWPLCNGELLPTLYGPVGANFAHRVGAALSVVLVMRLWLMARQVPNRPDLRRGATAAAWLIWAQVFSGALFALGYYNLLTQMLHITLIGAFWGVLSLLLLQVWPAGQSAGAVIDGVTA